MENGVAISNNLSVNQVDQWLETPRRVFQIEHKHQWTEKRLACHRMPLATTIIPREVQTSET